MGTYSRPAAWVTGRYPLPGWTVRAVGPELAPIFARVEMGELPDVLARVGAELDAYAAQRTLSDPPRVVVAPSAEEPGDIEAFKAERERGEDEAGGMSFAAPAFPSPYRPEPPAPVARAQLGARVAWLQLVRGPSLGAQLRREVYALADELGASEADCAAVLADLANLPT
jgi:hypothetical protein